MGVPPNHQKLMRRDLSIEPMVTWGSLILRTPCMHIYICIKMYKGWGPLGVYNCSSRGPPLYQSNYLLRQKKKCIFLGAQHLLRKNYLSGGIPRQRFVCFEKKGRFRQSETTDSFPKIGLKFPGNLKCFFDGVL